MPNIERIYRELTSVRHRWDYHDATSCPASLTQVLQKNLPNLPSESWQQRLLLGGTYVNGIRTFSDLAIIAPCRIEYFEPKYDISKYPDVFPRFLPEYVLHQDDDLVIVFKPPKLPSILTRDQLYCNLRTLAEKHLQCQLHLPSRLDHSAQGLMVLSKTTRMNLELHNAFSNHTIEKFYILEVSPAVTWKQQKLENNIGHHCAHPVLRQVVQNGGKYAVTEFTNFAQGIFYDEANQTQKTTSYLQAKLITGRTHQLRVHSSFLGSPIIGDNFYDGEESPELRLLSYRICYHHPFTGNYLDIKIPDNLLPDWLNNVPRP